MTRLPLRFAALSMLLGFLVGSTYTGQEPEASRVAVPFQETAESQVEPNYPVPYIDSPQPVRIRIPSIDVAADIDPVGMSDAVTMQVPVDIDLVGWFDRSVLPISEAGHTVLVGHRDGVSDPNGVFRNLDDVRSGDMITVRDLSGRRIKYVVKGVAVVSDKAFAQQASEIFQTHGAHQLILITCGGTYDASEGGYQANVVVTAHRV